MDCFSALSSLIHFQFIKYLCAHICNGTCNEYVVKNRDIILFKENQENHTRCCIKNLTMFKNTYLSQLHSPFNTN
ncbi:hypothetical protein QE441_003245 [Chryseobacterium sp. SORGH_AS909]|uniref:Secreted protein n=1 Tax=Chryseobacterium camelliae TaxID=1265445 RepID=A0ABU0TGT6_9FLAO|nr:hypothetical protein [Chryseobacterium camelliae]MDQ1100107.1 hypothetical protein [Chryseobacterium sp. SORGH_AS_1048]MDR6087451.1 hypothetical protein [Chryseobacterium sp. SORGH_AS_0909]MDR6131825.1 hypothetical protein [Chryseobacterium sp. SORGH_AS_1175]MDT3406028.1 hypothetical protein [Pseudacidovorax intermedius]